MRFAYQRTGRPLLQWGASAPRASRGADARSLGAFSVRTRPQLGARNPQFGARNPQLGSLGDDTLGAMPLPVPGGPEPISGVGCTSCRSSGMGLSFDDLPMKEAPAFQGFVLGVGVAVLAYKVFKKKRR